MRKYLRVIGVSQLLYALLLMASIFACTDKNDSYVEDAKSNINVRDLQKNWCGSYEGWDSLMNVKTTIKKELILNTDGTYTNFLFGKLDIPNAKEGPFESEGGTYKIEIEDTICSITFIAAYDSLIDFGAQTMIGYSHKHLHKLSGEEYEVNSYTQKLSIVNGEGGNHRLVAIDSTLFSLDGKGQPVRYNLDIKKNEL